MNRVVRALVAASLLMPAGARAAVTVTLAQNYVQMEVGQAWQAKATVTGTGNHHVIWQVDNANGGSTAAGKISKSGLYTAPSTVPLPAIATVTAVSAADPTVSATATVTLLSQPLGGNVYYVAPDGNDANPGNLAEPWKTIEHAADVAGAGDTVFVRQGVYNEHIRLRKSGTAGRYITFASYPGETAAVDGTGLDIPQNMWGLFTFDGASYVIVEGFEVRNYTTDSDKQVPIGIYVVGAGEGDQIVNNYLHDITTTAPATPKNCASNAFGMTVYGTQAPAAIDGLAISGNEVAFNHTGCSETLSLDGNVTNFAVVSNVVHDDDNIGIGAIGFEHVSKDPAYDQARDGVIRGNTVYNITSYGNTDYGKQYAADGIYVDGGTNIVIDQNRVHAVDLGIELASEHKGKTSSYIIARNNLVYDGNSAGISIGGYAANKGGTDHCDIVGNTLYGNDTKNTGSGEFQIQFNATGNAFENNIVTAGAQGLLVNDFTTSTPDPAALDDNLYFSAGPSDFVWQKQRYKSFASYVAGTGNDPDSAFADPQFVDTAEFAVAPTSPAVGAGTDLGLPVVGPRAFSGAKRILGGAIDIGAQEQ